MTHSAIKHTKQILDYECKVVDKKNSSLKTQGKKKPFEYHTRLFYTRFSTIVLFLNFFSIIFNSLANFKLSFHSHVFIA